MKFRALLPFVALAVIVGIAVFAGTTFYDEHQTQVFYSLDKKQNDQEVIRVIDGAKQYVYFAIYTFTKEDIADALVPRQGARPRGVGHHRSRGGDERV